MQRFKAAVKVLSLPVALTFDMGNWLWVDESPEEAARMLAPASAIFMLRPPRRATTTGGQCRRTAIRAGPRCSTNFPPTRRAGSNFRWKAAT